MGEVIAAQLAKQLSFFQMNVDLPAAIAIHNVRFSIGSNAAKGTVPYCRLLPAEKGSEKGSVPFLSPLWFSSMKDEAPCLNRDSPRARVPRP